MRRIVALAFVSLLAVSAIGSGLASAAPDVVVRGSCSDGARSRLQLADRGRRIEVNFKLHTGVLARDDWRIRMYHNGDPFVRGIRKAAGDSGWVKVHRGVQDGNGTDRFVARAVDTSTGEVCRAHAKI
jgi:hypothetical protein